MTLTLILALIFTTCLAVEAFSNDAIATKIARIVKFGCGAVFCLAMIL